ncbi:MAG: PepSY domain-containing protein [Pseudomonadales bacterium]|nr:PepSY domain-containing protein [Pseudomonadales bacterium]
MKSRQAEKRFPARGANAAACLLLGVLALPARAEVGGDWLVAAIDLLEQGRRPPPVLSINDAASRAQDRFGGQVISISPAEQDGRRGYRVKILLESGRVKTLFVEARTGAVIDRRGRTP